jgi:glycosyltransferase involved in cell wall biosynthesis
MDAYAEQLAGYLPVRKLHTSIFRRSADVFGIRPFGVAAAKTVAADLGFLRRICRLAGPTHLPNHHLGRYGLWLSQPYVVTVHDLMRYWDMVHGEAPFISRPNLRDRMLLQMDRRGIERAAAVIAVSEATAQSLVSDLGIHPARVHVVRPGIDHSVFGPSRRRLLDAPYLLFVGLEHPRKNLSLLFEAFAELKRHPDYARWKLVKVGLPGGAEGDFRQEARKLVEALGLGGEVVFTDRVSREDVVAYYSGAECTVMPSRYEGFGFPALEAMACGSPVVVSRHGALPEVVGEAGVVVDRDDPRTFAAAIARVARNRGLREELRRRGMGRARQFSWERCAEETMAVYRKIGFS